MKIACFFFGRLRGDVCVFSFFSDGDNGVKNILGQRINCTFLHMCYSILLSNQITSYFMRILISIDTRTNPSLIIRPKSCDYNLRAGQQLIINRTYYIPTSLMMEIKCALEYVYHISSLYSIAYTTVFH